MGMVLIYAFLRHSCKVLDFHGENPAISHLTFVVEIRHRFALGDMDCDNHTEMGEHVYICTMLAHIARK